MEKQFEEITYSRYQARIRDMRILKVDEGFEPSKCKCPKSLLLRPRIFLPSIWMGLFIPQDSPEPRKTPWKADGGLQRP